MSDLTPEEIELTAIGAAIGSNCIQCVEYHIKEAKKLGLTDTQILQAIRMAEKVRTVPAKKVSEAALNMLDKDITSLFKGMK